MLKLLFFFVRQKWGICDDFCQLLALARLLKLVSLPGGNEVPCHSCQAAALGLEHEWLKCFKVVRLSRRLDRIYSIDLVEAPFSVSSLFCLAQHSFSTRRSLAMTRGSFESAQRA